MRVRAGERWLARRVDVGADGLAVRLVIDADLLAAPPPEVVLELVGAPSAHGLRFRGGGRLERTLTRVFRLSPDLASGGPGLRPRSVAGGAFGRLRHDGSQALAVGFDGVVDPASVSPEACPLAREAEGLPLAPVLPEVAWSIVGEQTVLRLSGLPEGQTLELRLRDWQLRDLAGSSPSPLPIAVIDT